MNNINPIKSAFTSLISAFTVSASNHIGFLPLGFIQLEQLRIFMEFSAWAVAILAGIVSIVNGVKKWNLKRKHK